MRALGEDADLGPIRAIARVARRSDNLIFLELVEIEENFDVGKVLQAFQGVGRETGIEFDLRRQAAEDFVEGRADGGVDGSDGNKSYG
jgi:hypothetical protein